MTRAPTIGHDEVLRLVAEERALVVDALPPDEYAKQHLPGAINIPIQEFDGANVRDIDAERTIITYCADSECDLSARAAARFVTEGFANVYEYVGGIAGWGAYGLPFEGDNADVAWAGHLASKDLPRCGLDTPVRRIRFGDHSIAAVVDDEGVLLGRIRRDDVESGSDVKARELMSPKMSTFRPDVYVAEMADWFQKRPRATEFIITTPDGRVYGVLYRAAVERVLQAVGEKSPVRS